MLRAGHGLVLIVLTLLMFAVVMVSSAALTVDAEHAVSLRSILAGRQMFLAIVAVAALAVGAFVPVRRLFTLRGGFSPIPWIVLAFLILLVAVHLPGFGREVNGARRWLAFGPVGFQPSELAKWGLIVVIAWHAARRSGAMGRFATGFLPPMALVMLTCTLIATEDLGTAVLIGIVGVGLLLAGGARVLHVTALFPIGVLGFVAAVYHSPYRIDRLRAFLDPYGDPQGIGYHIIQSMSAVAGGGLAGQGLGSSVQKFGYLPEDTNDFIFAIICEELGAAGAAAVIGLYGALMLTGLSIVRRVEHPFERLLGLGVLVTIGLQAIINMAVVTGVAPTKGIALPLLSAGGTGWMLTAFSIGLLVSMDRERAAGETTIVSANVAAHGGFAFELERPGARDAIV